MTGFRFGYTLAFVTLLGGCSGGNSTGDDAAGPDASTCGNGVCDPGESSASCPADCATGPRCGDGKCDPGETTATCAMDCPAAACTVADPNSCTGETVCISGKCENAFGRNYQITVVSAVFTEKKANGDTWDGGGGLPDPKVKLTVNGATAITTPTINDTLMPVWNFVSAPTLIPGGTTFKIEVVDDDTVFDDPAWTCLNNPLAAALIRAGARCSGTGALANAHVDISFTPN